VRPDIIFISKEGKNIIKDRWVEGAPNLIVEIVSPASKEYWIVDPETKELVVLENDNGHFKLKCHGKKCKSSVLKDFSWGFKDD